MEVRFELREEMRLASTAYLVDVIGRELILATTEWLDPANLGPALAALDELERRLKADGG